MNKRFIEFRTAIEDMSSTLNKLHLAQDIIKSKHRETFRSEIRNLAEYSLAQLHMVKDVLEKFVAHARSANPSEPLPFANEVHKLSTKTTQEFGKWHLSYKCLNDLLGSSTRKKERNSEAVNAMAELENSFASISGFTILFAMDLLYSDGRQDTRPSQPENDLFNDPFAVNDETSTSVVGVLSGEIARLTVFLGSF
jgi:hypothetical protein